MAKPVAVGLLILTLSSLLAPPHASSANALVVEEVATGLVAPWAMDFANDGTLYLTERPGRVRVVRQGLLDPQPAANLTVTTFQNGESGLLGLVLDRNFDSNHYVYVYYTYTDSAGVKNKISRLTETGGKLENEATIFDGIKGGAFHDGGRLKIGPDGKLYATTGDAGNQSSAQDVSSTSGKILRLNLDGSIPSENPFPNSPVYSLGHRHPQGLSWNTAGRLVSSEHGPSGNDEINLIQAGGNYGWPTVYGVAGDQRFLDPILSTGSDTWAPSGMTFYSAPNIPEWTGKFLVATLRGHHLRVLDISFSSSPTVVSSGPFFPETYGRLRDVVQGPDGFVYIATSNRDGRGTLNTGDDKILRITGTGGLPAENPFPLLLVSIAAVAIALPLSIAIILLLNRRRPSAEKIQALSKGLRAWFLRLSHFES